MNKRLIEEKAQKVLNDAGVFGMPPVDVYEICRQNAINVVVADLSTVEESAGGKISGAILLDNSRGRKTIFINEKDIPTRQRFTIAHELGHFFLHRDDIRNNNEIQLSFRAPKSEDIEKEKAADKFAANLLMPADEVRKLHRAIGYPIVSYMADKFEVSVQAMKYRLNEMGLKYIG